MRVSYRSDSAYLIRFSGAVTKDTRRTEAWKREMRLHLNAASQLLLQAEAEDLAAEEKKSVRRRTKSVAGAA
jgi:hypothetical protein